MPEAAWRRLSAGNWVYIELADLEAGEYNSALTVMDTQPADPRNIADGDLAYFSTWTPAGTPIETLVRVEGHRWAIEDNFETAKNELGLDHNETRSWHWHGWHRHVSLVVLAFAMKAAIRHGANATTPPKKDAPDNAQKPPLIRWPIQEIRRIATRLSR